MGGSIDMATRYNALYSYDWAERIEEALKQRGRSD